MQQRKILSERVITDVFMQRKIFAGLYAGCKGRSLQPGDLCFTKGMQDASCRMQDAGYRMQDVGYRIAEGMKGLQIPVVSCRMWDTGSKMQDAGYRIAEDEKVAGYRLPVAGFGYRI